MKNFLKSFALVMLFCSVVLVGCNEDKEPEPQVLTGKLLTYTNIKSSEFDRIDIIVNGKVAGTLTAPYTVKPTCGADNSASASSIVLPAGIHKVYAVQYKDGKNVGEWNEEDETINADKCTLINWVD